MPPINNEPPKTILILAANPRGTIPLRLDEEVREIKAGLQRSRHRDQFVVEYESAARWSDVHQFMLDYEPQIVHFCGHGMGKGGLVLEDDNGEAKLISTEALADLFRANAYKSTYLNKHQLRPLYCEWSHQSELIAKKVDCFSVV